MNEQPHPTRVRLLPWQIPDRLFDAALIVVVTVGFLVRRIVHDGGYRSAEWTALAVAIVLVVVRRRYPLHALAVAIAAAAAVVAATEEPTVLLPIALVALFNVAQQFERRTTLIAGAVTTACFLLMMIVFLDEVPLGGAGLASIAWPAFATAAGAAVRSARESVSAAEERALLAEESRDLEAQRRVVEERLRIARDVHDLVAHHIAVVNVQSAVAGHLIESDPHAAREALDVVRGAASTVIDQLGELLGVLRSPDDGDEPTAPTPGLAELEPLMRSFATSGLAVQAETTGAPRSLSGLGELTAYRVVQEALTNAHKHGDGTAAVSLRFDDNGLNVAVSNPTRASTTDGSHGSVSHRSEKHSASNTSTDNTSTDNHGGFGLIGMRERIEGIGGTFAAGTTRDGRQFEIAATIPGKDHE